jgi:hypothetical protein
MPIAGMLSTASAARRYLTQSTPYAFQYSVSRFNGWGKRQQFAFAFWSR